MLVRPRLTDADWERVLADRKTANAQRRDQPEAVVSVVSDRLLFGDAHPYGRPVEGFSRTLERLTLDDVRAFHQPHWRPNHAFLVVAGAFDEASLRARLEAALGGWTGSPPPEPTRRRPGPRARASASSIARARPRASCGWWRRAPIACRPIARAWRC